MQFVSSAPLASRLSPWLLAAVASMAATLPAPVAAQSTEGAEPAGFPAVGVGDPYFPDAGAAGIDVLAYDLDLSVDMESGAIEGLARVTLRTTQALSQVGLDLVGLTVRSIELDGEEVTFMHAGRDLLVNVAAPGLTPVEAGTELGLTIAYGGVPALAPDASVESLGVPGVGWWKKATGVYTISECVGAASWFPCNDHPIDKATLKVAVTVAEPWVVAANGILVEETSSEGPEGVAQKTYRFEARDPMATYLATVNIARFEVRREEGPGGLPLTLYYPEGAEEGELAAFSRTGEMLTFFSERFGPYPFECFGGVLSYEPVGGALETQTLPLYSRGTDESTVAHELAHQWFGNAVSVERWEDLWLNEGFASYAEWLWREHLDGPEALTKRAQGTYSFLRRRGVKAPFDPGVQGLWTSRTYARGAMVLHALRLELGDDAFFTLCRTWTARHHNGNASTADFVALAEEVAERELDDFFAAWVFADPMPEIPAALRK